MILKGKHFSNVEVVVGLVELHRISGRSECRVYFQSARKQKCSWKKKAVVFTNVTANAYQGQLNAGFSKVCGIFKVHGIESLKYVRELHTPVCYCGDISTPQNMTLNETNCDWLFDMSVKRPWGRALASEGCHLFQTFSRQSEGLATRDYVLSNCRASFKYSQKGIEHF